MAFALRSPLRSRYDTNISVSTISVETCVNLNFVEKMKVGEILIRKIRKLVITILITEGVDKKIKRVYNAISKIINLLRD